MRTIRNTAAFVALLALIGAGGLAVAATQTAPSTQPAPSAPAKGVLTVTYYYLPG